MKDFIKKDLISIIETFGFDLKTDYFKKLFADLLVKKEDHTQFKALETFSIIPTWYLKLYYSSIFVCFFEADIQIIIFDSEFLGEKFFWKFQYDLTAKSEIIKNICFAIERYRFKYPYHAKTISQEFLLILEKKIIPLLKTKERKDFKKVLDKYDVKNINEISLGQYYLIIYDYLNKNWDTPVIIGIKDNDEYLKALLRKR